MAGVTYKCPSCGAYLNFDPDTQEWKCPFCASAFQEKELLGKAEQYEREAETEAAQAAKPDGGSGAQVVYHCPSCGSEIMTDETTVATHCYYCHNPVVLQGKLTADLKPDAVLPFTIGKDKAVAQFMGWAKKKRFIPKGFFSEAEVNTMTGVYYPHFVSDCTVDGSFSGEGINTDVVTTAKYVITNTKHYRVRREGRITFRSIMRPALGSVNRKLSDGIHPFPLESAKPFSGAYLSGFVAERRDIDEESIRQDVASEVERYVEPILTQDMPYSSYNGSASCDLKELKTKYVMLPTWVLTYPNKQKPDDPYYYAMNGCTGEVCGKLPIQKSRVFKAAAVIAAGIFAVGCVLSYFFF